MRKSARRTRLGSLPDANARTVRMVEAAMVTSPDAGTLAEPAVGSVPSVV
jgi:hypothetical protein